ncbi:MAG TPA: hypothetical protein HA362_00605 [Nanoarchaeota archaeon]|nr:hypothetical protein [Nanoarchaeota archaeon]
MKKLLLFLLLAAVLVSGCGSSGDRDCVNQCMEQDHPDCVAGGWSISGAPPDCVCEYICPEGRNDNAVAEPAETEPACTEECDSSGCLGPAYYECVSKPGGCKGKSDLKVAKGRCGIECLSNSDCSGQECVAYKCKAQAVSLDLKDLPGPFSEDAILIVGANAPGSDVAAQLAVSSMLLYEGGKKFESKLDTQVSEEDYSHNLVLIGSPCDNTIIEKVFGIVCDGLALNANQAMLKLADSRGKAALLISGKTPAATLKAANQVANYGDYGLSGSEMVINAA